MTKREELRKLEMSLDYFKGHQFAVDKAIELRKEIEDTDTYANHIGYSDVYPYEIIERRTDKKIIIRAMNSELDETWKPDIVLGGFVGHCVNNGEQRWIITSNEKMTPIVIRKHSDGKWYDKNKMRFSLSDEPCRHYDYNF